MSNIPRIKEIVNTIYDLVQELHAIQLEANSDEEEEFFSKNAVIINLALDINEEKETVRGTQVVMGKGLVINAMIGVLNKSTNYQENNSLLELLKFIKKEMGENHDTSTYN